MKLSEKINKTITEAQSKCKLILENQEVWRNLTEISAIVSNFPEPENEFEANKAFFLKRGIENLLIFIQQNGTHAVAIEQNRRIKINNICPEINKIILKKHYELLDLENKANRYKWLLRFLP